MKLPRVILADDHTMLLEAFARLLEGKCDILEMATDGRSLVRKALELKPDIVIADMYMQLLNGLEAGWLLNRKAPRREADISGD
jgi:DNA-binding NarL/FixJ family response regulator